MKKNFLNIIAALVLAMALVGCSMPSGTSESSQSAASTTASGIQNSVSSIVLPPSQVNPKGLPASQVPMFVSIGFDDNAYTGFPGTAGTGGMKWALDYFKNKVNPGTSDFGGTPARVSFFYTAVYGESWQIENPDVVRQAWRQAYVDGHEVGNHSLNHPNDTGRSMTVDSWLYQMQQCHDFLTRPETANGLGIPASDISGWRTPHLAYNNNTFTALSQMPGYVYDCSINEGFEYDQDGTNYFWPYTLDNGSPGNAITASWGSDPLLTSHPGIFELPVYALIVPPDNKCAEYGVPAGLRDKMKAAQSWFDVASGKITGFDYNLWFLFGMTKAEFLATLKYSLDIRHAGNRAPFMLGAHTDYYSDRYNNPPGSNSTYIERQQAIEEFMDYALAKQDVRVVPFKNILSWITGNPVPQVTVTIETSAGGTANPIGPVKVPVGGSLEITALPDPGYEVAEVIIDGVTAAVVNNTINLQNITKDTLIRINFRLVGNTYTITATSGPGGRLDPEGDVVVAEGSSVTFTAIPDAGFALDTVVYNGNPLPVTGNQIVIPNVMANGTLHATFVGGPLPLTAEYTITSDWGSGFNGQVTIKNTSTQTINGWKAEWTYQGNTQVTSLWNGSFTQVGQTVTVTNLSWNGTLVPGQSVSFGFGGTNADPAEVITVVATPQ